MNLAKQNEWFFFFAFTFFLISLFLFLSVQLKNTKHTISTINFDEVNFHFFYVTFFNA